MSKYSTIYDTSFYKVYRWADQFPNDTKLLYPPEALFTRLSDAIEWASRYTDGKNYNVVVLNGKLETAFKFA